MLYLFQYLPHARLFTPPIIHRSCPRTTFTSLLSQSNPDACAKTLASGSFECELEVKKSRFIGYAKHVQTWDQAQEYLAHIKAIHPKARHWCYGFRCGSNPVNERSCDDGEPTGTAGAPILNTIRGQELSDTVVCVVRYFGGIKLGARGLIRAYGATARQVLSEAQVEILIPMRSVRFQVDSSHVGSLYELVGKFSASTSQEDYLMDGSVEVTVTCEAQHMDDFCTNLKDATRGKAVFLD